MTRNGEKLIEPVEIRTEELDWIKLKRPELNTIDLNGFVE